jgi:HEAT repeat protein
LLAQCDQEWEVALNDAASAVLELDPARAAIDFASERWLSPSNPNVYKILEECNQASILLPESLVRRLLDHSLPRAVGEKCYPHQYVAAAALVALAMKSGDEVRALLECALSSDQDIIQEAAARAIAKLADLNDPVGFVLERKEQVGFERLSKPQQVVCCCYVFDAEVCNGGITQFFGNTSGDLTAETLEALKTIGHKEAVNALQTAMRLLGPLSRERDRDLRLEAFQNRFDELQAAFRPLEDEYYRKNGLLRQRILLYAVANAEHFRG